MEKNVIPEGTCRLKGLISNRRRLAGSDGQYWMTILKMPARDAYSHPATVELYSKSPLGDLNQEWQGLVEITGYPRSYNSKPDPETGEIKRIQSADNRLRVIES